MDQEFDLEGAPLDNPGDGFTIPDGRLSVAVSMCEADDILQMGRMARCRNHRTWTKILEAENISTTTPVVCFDYHSCISNWLIQHCQPEKDLRIIDVLKMSVAQLNLARGHQYANTLPRIPDPGPGYSSLTPIFNLRRSADRYKDWYRTTWKGHPIRFECDHVMIYDATLSMFTCPTHGKSIAPTSLILSALDSIQRRCSALIFAASCDITNSFPGQSYYAHMCRLDHVITNARSQLGNNIYRILAVWYSFFVSVIITQPGDLNCYKLGQEVLNSISQHIPAFSSSELYREMTARPSSPTHMKMLFESIGISKAYGHPIVDFEEGLNIVREYACVDRGTDLSVATEVERTFKSRFCMSFYRKFGRWPEVLLTSNAHPILVESVSNNTWPRDNVIRDLDDSIFDELTFSKTFEFDYHIEVFDIINDKSCAPELPSWTSLYDPCSFELHHGLRIRTSPPVERRVVSRFLTSYPGRTKDVIDAINEGRAPDKDNIVVLVPKESELKMEARPFAIVTYDKRLHVRLIGKNLGKDLTPLFSSQTTNDSEIAFLRKVSRYASESKQEDSNVIYIVLDFKKFNLQFHLWLLAKVLRCLDLLYGFENVFYDAHAFYTRAYFLANTRTRPPKPQPNGFPTPGTSCHVDHFGATEGMVQRLWSIVASLMIEKAMQFANLRGSIIGQGDNQVIICRLTADQSSNATEVAKDFLDHLERSQDRFQVPIKKTECWFSRNVYEANKELYVKGVQLSNGTKYAIKAASDANDANNLLETRIASISTIAESVSKRMANPDAAYLLSTIELITQTYNHQVFGPDIDEYKVAPLWGTALGGLPITTYNQLVMRGHPDRLTIACSFPAW